MNWNELKNSINEWVWDNDERTYFWVLGADEDTKKVKARGLSGLETEFFYCADRYFKDAKK